MTETDQAPTLTWGPETTRIVVGATMATAGLLRQRRMEMGRFAFSDAEDAARRFDRVQRAADPSARFMDDAERRSWDAERRVEDSLIERRVVRDQSNILCVEVGPLADSRWGVRTRYQPSSPHEPVDAHSMSLSCADELTARELAEELMAGGPDRDRSRRLEGFVSLASRRSALGASEVREPEQQRHARAAQAVRQVWEGTLAEEVVSSKAFGALAWRLFELEERGYAMTDVLRRIDDSRLRRADVRNPAALAEFFVVQMMPNLRVINLDGDLSAQPQPDRTTGTHPRTGTGDQSAARPGQEPAAGEEHAIGPLLAAALPPEVLEKVRRAPSYDRLRRDLFERYQQGRPVARLLEDLAVGEVAEATDPAGYLAGIVRRRADTDPLRATQVNRAGMAELVQRGLPREAADKVVDCQAWPGLASGSPPGRPKDYRWPTCLPRSPPGGSSPPAPPPPTPPP